MVKVGVIGASGYAGGELLRYLLSHPDVKITHICSDTYKGKHIGCAFPNLLGCDLPLCKSFTDDLIGGADVFFLARHHCWAIGAAPRLIEAGKKVIDISADFRFRDAAVFEQWYKTAHLDPELTKQAVYGLTELKKEAVAAASLVANPGCYPTGALLAIAPAVLAGLVDAGGIIIDAKSGVSGAGRSKADVKLLFSEADESLRPYGVGEHRHTPEIEQELSEIAGKSVKVSFTPHLVPMVRGILTTTYAPLVREVTTSEVVQIYKEQYAQSLFIVVLDEGEYPATKSVSGSNYCHIGIKVDNRTGRLVVMSAIDNMGKGASGQAVQNMNVMLGLPENAGLAHLSVYP